MIAPELVPHRVEVLERSMCSVLARAGDDAIPERRKIRAGDALITPIAQDGENVIVQAPLKLHSGLERTATDGQILLDYIAQRGRVRAPLVLGAGGPCPSSIARAWAAVRRASSTVLAPLKVRRLDFLSARYWKTKLLAPLSRTRSASPGTTLSQNYWRPTYTVARYLSVNRTRFWPSAFMTRVFRRRSCRRGPFSKSPLCQELFALNSPSITKLRSA
jgi:hypothetical protein